DLTRQEAVERRGIGETATHSALRSKPQLSSTITRKRLLPARGNLRYSKFGWVQAHAMQTLLAVGRAGGQERAWRTPATAVGIVAATVGWLLDAPNNLSHRLVLHLEGTFHRPNLEDGRAITGVIALGGGEDRIREAGRLARRYPRLQVVVTGAGGR